MSFLSTEYCKCAGKLIGKTVLVTGCNSGIGKEIIKDFYERGARVLMICRNIEKSINIINEIEDKYKYIKNPGKLILIHCDLSSKKSIKICAQQILNSEHQITILINNAGVIMTPERTTDDGFEIHFGTNYLGAKLNLDDIQYSKRQYDPLTAYSDSMLTNIIFSNELARRLMANNITDISTYCVDPGFTNTDIGREMIKSYLWGAMPVYSYILGLLFLRTPLQGAQTAIHCAISHECADQSGLYYRDCEIAVPSKSTLNKDIAEDLWNLSLKLTELEDYDPFTIPDPGFHVNYFL